MFELPKHSRVGGWNPTPPQLCVICLTGFQAWLSCPGLLFSMVHGLQPLCYRQLQQPQTQSPANLPALHSGPQ